MNGIKKIIFNFTLEKFFCATMNSNSHIIKMKLRPKFRGSHANGKIDKNNIGATRKNIL